MRALGGEIILRIEDLDKARAVPGASRGIVEDLTWLGIDWDNDLAPEYFQSNRFARYQYAVRELCRQGLAYECFCSRKELREIASAPHEPVSRYPGYCRDFQEHHRAALRPRKEPARRFRVERGTVVAFTDGIAGPQCDDLYETTGDFIIARADGVPSYQLAVVLDDLAMGITHVLRGDDLLSSTGRQILLFTTFGGTPPSYSHVPLILAPNGTRLAKRHGSVSIAELRAAGRTPESLVGWLAWSCGLLPSPQPCKAAELIGNFALEKIKGQPGGMEPLIPGPDAGRIWE